MLQEHPGITAARRADVQCLTSAGKLAELAGEDGTALLVPPVAVLK